MIGNEDSAARAFEILGGWQWGYYDPDGCWHGRSKTLADVVNRLAFQGHHEPASAVLTLLCDGKISAICNYNWLKYQRSTRYAISEHMETLDPSKWQTLAQVLREEIRMLEDSEWGSPLIDLPKLDVKDSQMVEWEPSFNRCSYAARPPDTSTYDPSYFEESLSAWEIEIMLISGEPTESEILAFSQSENEDTQSCESASALSPISQSELAKWWESKSDVRDFLSQDELLALVRAKYADKAISRDRVRELIGTRKRGPKPIRGDFSAK